MVDACDAGVCLTLSQELRAGLLYGLAIRNTG